MQIFYSSMDKQVDQQINSLTTLTALDFHFNMSFLKISPGPI